METEMINVVTQANNERSTVNYFHTMNLTLHVNYHEL